MHSCPNRVFAALGFAAVLSLSVCSQGGTWSSLDYPGAFATFAQAINSSGVIVGGYVLPDNSEHGFVYSNGQFSQFDVPGAAATVVTGVNDIGGVAGYYGDPSLVFHSFIYDGQDFTYLDYPGVEPGTTILGQINNSGAAVGTYVGDDSLHHGFSYSKGIYKTIDFPGASETYGYGVNNKGMIAGGYTTSANTHMQGFLYSTTFSTLDYPKHRRYLCPGSKRPARGGWPDQHLQWQHSGVQL